MARKMTRKFWILTPSMSQSTDVSLLQFQRSLSFCPMNMLPICGRSSPGRHRAMRCGQFQGPHRKGRSHCHDAVGGSVSVHVQSSHRVRNWRLLEQPSCLDVSDVHGQFAWDRLRGVGGHTILINFLLGIKIDYIG